MECPHNLLQYKGFNELFTKLNNLISEEGVTKELQADFAEVGTSLEESKRNYLQRLLLYTELKEILADNNYGIDDQTFHDKSAVNDVYRDLARRFGAMEAKTCLNIYMGNNGEREENLLGLSPEDFDETPRQKKIQDQNIQQLVIPILERNLQKKLIDLYKFWNSSGKEDSEGLLLAKANQLASAIKKETKKVKELQKTLKEEQYTLSKVQHEHTKKLRDSLQTLQRNLESSKHDVSIDTAGVTADWLDAKCNFLLGKIQIMKNHLYSETYTKENIDALRKVREHLNNEITKTKDEVQKTRHSLAAYESVGDRFKELLSQYNNLTIQIDNKKWALRELQKSKNSDGYS